jgi:hypothetical protein
MRFSIRWLLATVIFAAIAAAATARPNYWWACGLWSAAVATLCAALVGSIICQNAKRAFWISFAVFGWAHFVLAFGPWFHDHTGGLLLTRQLLIKIGQAANPAVKDIDTSQIWIEHTDPAFLIHAYPSMQFIVAGQSLFTVLIALAGGYIGRSFYRTGRGNALVPPR